MLTIQTLEALRASRQQAEDENRRRLEKLATTGVIAREPHGDVVGLRGGWTIIVERDATLETKATG